MKLFHEFCKNNNIPLTTLSNFDIIRIAKQLKIKYFRGVFMRDSDIKRLEQMSVELLI